MMDIQSLFTTKMVYIIVFYMATNIVPSNVDQFKIETQNLKDRSEKLTLNFTKKEGNWWRADAQQHPDEYLTFRFDKNLNCEVYERDRVKRKDTIPVGKLMTIKQNHKKWKKATEVSIKSLSADTKESLIFKIEKTGRKQRVIRLGSIKIPKLKEMPAMHVSW